MPKKKMTIENLAVMIKKGFDVNEEQHRTINASLKEIKGSKTRLNFV